MLALQVVQPPQGRRQRGRIVVDLVAHRAELVAGQLDALRGPGGVAHKQHTAPADRVHKDAQRAWRVARQRDQHDGPVAKKVVAGREILVGRAVPGEGLQGGAGQVVRHHGGRPVGRERADKLGLARAQDHARVLQIDQPAGVVPVGVGDQDKLGRRPPGGLEPRQPSLEAILGGVGEDPPVDEREARHVLADARREGRLDQERGPRVLHDERRMHDVNRGQARGAARRDAPRRVLVADAQR